MSIWLFYNIFQFNFGTVPTKPYVFAFHFATTLFVYISLMLEPLFVLMNNESSCLDLNHEHEMRMFPIYSAASLIYIVFNII